MSEEPKRTANPRSIAGAIVGIIGGWGFSQYAGSALWIPFAATLALFFIGSKTPLRPKYFAGAICVTGGHVIWFIVASAMASLWAVTFLDILVLGIAIVWLWLRPGIPSALFLGVVQLGSLVLNGYALFSHPVGSTTHQVLSVHCLWRVLALALLIAGYRQWQKERNGVTAPAPLPQV